MIQQPAPNSPTWSLDAMAARLVRYEDLVPCYNAFVDTRTPGSQAKENFTIIGPGVSENPQQHVHIAEPHGFNIGGARQPPGCVNSQHSHETAELFVVHSGRWSFNLGEHGTDAQVVLEPGDVISIPTHIFRGFENVGEDLGFLWAVLGGDDPGHVTWAPHVFDLASRYGLILLENGSLVDTVAGQSVPAGLKPMPPTTAAQAAAMRKMTPDDVQAIVVRGARLADRPISRVVGADGPFAWPHGFTLDRLGQAAGDALDHAASPRATVLFVHRGAITLSWTDGALALGPGDTLSIPPGLAAHIVADAEAILFRVSAQA